MAFMAAVGISKFLRSLRLAVSASLLVVLVSSGMGCNSEGGAPQAQAPQATPTAATPAITPNGGAFTAGYPVVTITDSTPGAAIYHTTDGSAATSASAVYSAPFTLNSAATVQAIATASGYSTSLAASAAFQLQTASGTYTLTITPTAIATGSSKPLQISPIQLTLTVK
jgi:Chitobiase/beta-hexosaminidase C-terminal domain